MKPKTVIFFVVIVAMLINLAGIFYFYTISNQLLKEQVTNHLETAAESRARHIETFLEEQKEKALIIANTDSYEDFLFSEVRDESDVKEIIEELTEILESNDDFSEMSLLDKKGVVVASTNEELIGKTYEIYVLKEEEIKETANVKISGVHYSDFRKTNVLDVSTLVVKDDFGLVGTLIMETKLEELAEITTDRTGLGETGEIIIINKEGFLITPSRFLGGNAGILAQEVRTENSEECLEDLEEYADPESGEVEEHEEEILSILFYVGYSGEKVLGVHSYVEDKWCLLAEISESEVLGSVRNQLLIVSLFILVITSVFLFLLAYFSGRFLDKRISKLRGKGK